MIIVTKNSEQTYQLGKKIGSRLAGGEVLCLTGQLGAGKTVFAKGVAKGLGVSELVNSPTFNLINEYQGRLVFYHMDMYRLKSGEEARDLGIDDYLNESGVVLIEWAENIAVALPECRLDIEIMAVLGEEKTREFIFRPWGVRYKRFVKEMERECTSWELKHRPL